MLCGTFAGSELSGSSHRQSLIGLLASQYRIRNFQNKHMHRPVVGQFLVRSDQCWVRVLSFNNVFPSEW